MYSIFVLASICIKTVMRSYLRIGIVGYMDTRARVDFSIYTFLGLINTYHILMLYREQRTHINIYI